jgi:drug/metabolite transporter (DMT)-like permease
MLLPFALWGTAMAAMRPLLESGSPLQVASLRLLPAGVLVLLAALLLGRSLRVAAVDWPWLLAFALVDGSLFQGLLARGLGQTGAGLGSVLIDSQPLLVALLARSLLGEAINPVGWVGLLLGLLGILCLGLPAPAAPMRLPPDRPPAGVSRRAAPNLRRSADQPATQRDSR